MADRERELQRAYYDRTSQSYDASHLSSGDEHALALAILGALCEFHGFGSLLDVGSGTGRALVTLRSSLPEMRCVGIEPVASLRSIGHAKGIPPADLIEGDATALPFADGHFDVVSEFGVLHHLPDPAAAIGEMFRVAARAVFISDSNNFAQGSRLARIVKIGLRTARLWRLADLVKTRGRGYTISEGDGLAYSYSVFNNRRQILALSERVHLFNTQGGWGNPLWSHPHLCLLAIKRDSRSR